MIHREIPNPYQPLFRSLIAGAFLMNIPAVIALLSGHRLITTYLGVFQFMMFILGIVLLVKGKQQVRGIMKMLQGELLVHWTYPSFQWKRYAEMEYRRNMKEAMITMVVFLLAGPLLAYIGYKDMSLTYGIVIGSLLGLFGGAIGIVHARGILRRSKKPPFEAMISKDAAFINGVFIDWTAANVRLADVDILQESGESLPSILLKYSLRGKYGRQHKELHVPIPNGSMNDAKRIVSTLKPLVLSMNNVTT